MAEWDNPLISPLKSTTNQISVTPKMFLCSTYEDVWEMHILVHLRWAYWNTQMLNRNGAWSCNSPAALAEPAAPANTVVVEELGCSPHITAWQKERRAAAALVPENPWESSSFLTVVLLTSPERLVAAAEMHWWHPRHSTAVPAAIGDQVAASQASKTGSPATCHLPTPIPHYHTGDAARPRQPMHSRGTHQPSRPGSNHQDYRGASRAG